MKGVDEIRQLFISKMKEGGHHILPSSSLVPENDTTTLFTGSGMQALISYLSGEKHPCGSRLANSQKCFRAEDIEEVGDNRHTTFFEMLGNWSLGDYGKKEQITNLFNFLTDKKSGLGLNPEKLFITVFIGDEKAGIPRDDESAGIWKELFEGVGVEAGVVDIGSVKDGDKRGIKDGERIFFYDAVKNWWSRAGSPQNMPDGEIGGADTEVFFDFGIDQNNVEPKPHPNSESGRFVEIGNSVFMEYIKKDGSFIPLPQKNVDFGAGLERLSIATMNKPDIFLCDALSPLVKTIEKCLGVSYENESHKKGIRVIADHLRAFAFIVADGILPDKEERGYIARRLLRRALLHKIFLNENSETTLPLFDTIADTYKTTYPHIAEKTEEIKKVFDEEEKKFSSTLKKAKKRFDDIVANGKDLSGEDAFALQSTYGLPLEMIKVLSKESGVDFNESDYLKAMEQHKRKSREESEGKFKGGLADTSEMSVKYHTATHLLHQALRDVLGDRVEQKGSNITKERLRFDFSHPQKLTDDEIIKIENIVNEKIKEGLEITKIEVTKEEAKKMGALCSADDKYGDMVTVYSIGDYSKEFCGGPHVTNTRDLGTFKITKEESVSKGVRRIKAQLG